MYVRSGGLCAALMLTLLCSCKKAAEPEKPRPAFINVAAEAGLQTVIYCGGPDKDHLVESLGCGVAFFDYDSDGQLDIYVVNAFALDEHPSAVRLRGRNALYRNMGEGRFTDVSSEAGVDDDGWGVGVCVGDYNNDGLDDLYVTNFGPNRLYRNMGDGTFEEVSAHAGVADAGWGGGASFFDADLDGDLDLYVVNYVECTIDEVLSAVRTRKWRESVKVMSGPFGMRGGRDVFFRNNGDGTFTDATEEAGLTDRAEGYGLGVVASDLDNDGDVDLYVANDSNPNYLYRNEGNGTFAEIGAWSGAGYSADGAAQAGMGVDAGDVDGDGLQDVFVTNFARDHCTLYRNQGDLFFEDVSRRWQVNDITFRPLSWGCAFFDYDQDADLDLVIANGHIYPQVDQMPELEEQYKQQPLLLQNEGGRFAESPFQSSVGFQTPISARGLAVGDYDADGDLDLLISTMDAPPVLLQNNVTPHGHWVNLRLKTQQGAYAINARADVTVAGLKQVREVRSGSTYVSQNSMDLHFGLGEHKTIDSIVVHWPGRDGKKTELQNVAADQTIFLTEP